MEYSIPFVCLFGIGTVFLSLITIIILSMIMSKVVGSTVKQPAAPKAAAPAAPAAPAVPQEDPQLMAAIAAAIADDLHINLENVQITSIKQA